MKMAKASEQDLRMANDLAGILESFERGYFPDPQGNDTDEPVESRWFDRDDSRHCVEAMEMILDTLRNGSLFRVTFGMLVVCDPRNRLLDPASDVLAPHPDANWAMGRHDELVRSLALASDLLAVRVSPASPAAAQLLSWRKLIAEEAAYGLFRYLAGGAFA